MENSKTGRDLPQMHGMGASPSLNHCKDFDALAMPRRPRSPQREWFQPTGQRHLQAQPAQRLDALRRI
jgi:hypothetical protein